MGFHVYHGPADGFETQLLLVDASTEEHKWASSLYDPKMRHIIGSNSAVISKDVLTRTTLGCDQSHVNSWSLGEYECGSLFDLNLSEISATCKLYHCVKDTKAEAKGGVFTERIVHTAPISKSTPLDGTPYSRSLVDFPCMIYGDSEKYTYSIGEETLSRILVFLDKILTDLCSGYSRRNGPEADDFLHEVNYNLHGNVTGESSLRMHIGQGFWLAGLFNDWYASVESI
jgi:hypothetical protein